MSPTLEGICQKAMARVPADRFATASEFGAALAVAAGETRTPYQTDVAQTGTLSVGVAEAPAAKRRTAVPAAIAAGLAMPSSPGPQLAWWRIRHRLTDPQIRRLAVLPFENLGAPEDAYFAEGITDEVRGKLTALRGFAVTARASAAQDRTRVRKLRSRSARSLASITC